MQRFHCHCGHEVFFDNTHCLACGANLGYDPSNGRLQSIKPAIKGYWKLADESGNQTYRTCINVNAAPRPCNWLIEKDDPHDTCLSCRLTTEVADLSDADDHLNWTKAEAAKRRLIHGLKSLNLPVRSRDADPETGLSFALLASHRNEENGGDTEETPVMIGHQNGLITMDITEADELHRTRVRLQMQERYRTLLGHYRHETGHYYHWLLIPPDSDWESAFVALFGDPNQDYGEALKAYYANGPVADWQSRFVSAYASAHPMEDWAECFSHYLHIHDALETATEFRLIPPLPKADKPGAYEKHLKAFLELNIAHNALSRSLGLPDAYPFVLNPSVQAKLRLVHEILSSSAESA